jgi:hypothetical protein
MRMVSPRWSRRLPCLSSKGRGGRDAAILRNNLAIARSPLEGPARSLSEFEEGIAFCEQRGLVESAWQLEANCPGLLGELGRPGEALERASRLVAVYEASGDRYALIEVRAVELAIRLDRGQQRVREEADWLVETARTIGTRDIIVIGLSSASAALAPEVPERARAALAELEQSTGSASQAARLTRSR